MEIVPDSKDWTWVLKRQCPECGFDTRSVELAGLPSMIRGNAAAWQGVLGGDRVSVSARPEPGKWCALEYGCHVRDVLRLYDCRLQLMLAQDNPLYPNWDQDETALAEQYSEQDPARVSAELVQAAETIACRFAYVTGEQWSRKGTRNDGAEFTVETFARYFIHDPVHHLYDVTGQQAGSVIPTRTRSR